MIGTLGRIVFQSSTDRVFTFNNLSRSGSPRYEEHNVIAKKPKLEFVGAGLDTVTFTIRLDRFLGITPEDEIKRIREARDKGQVLPFTLGGTFNGDWVITAVTETLKSVDNKGKIIIAELSLTIKEYSNEQSI